MVYFAYVTQNSDGHQQNKQHYYIYVYFGNVRHKTDIGSWIKHRYRDNSGDGSDKFELFKSLF